jgi:hypothetical protein
MAAKLVAQTLQLSPYLSAEKIAVSSGLAVVQAAVVVVESRKRL